MALLPCFGMYTRLTGWALNGTVAVLHPVGQLHLGLRGEHHLAVHARRQTTGVALRHPPHAHQRVRARTEHQLLQTADPWKVPRLRRREDPLPQPPYARLDTHASRSGASQGSRPLVRSPRPRSWRLTCPSVPGSSSSSSSQAHLTASARFRVRARGPVSGRLSRTTGWRGQPSLSRFPVAFRPPAFASRSSDSRRGVGPSLRSAYRTRPSGPRRGYRVPHARATTGVGASYTPRTAMLTRPTHRLRPAPAASQRPVPTPRYNIPSSGASDNEASTEVHAIHPSGLPLACRPPGWNGRPWASPRASHPADQEPDDARQGGDRP